MVMELWCNGKRVYKNKKNTELKSRIRWWKLIGHKEKECLEKMKEKVV